MNKSDINIRNVLIRVFACLACVFQILSCNHIKNEEDKSVDNIVRALKKQSIWVDSFVDSDIKLLKNVKGFDGSSVEWESLNKAHCSDEGEITKDIIDIKVSIKAKITWEGKRSEAIFSTTIKRYDKIEKTKTNGGITETITWDFSKKNLLQYILDGKVTNIWEIKSVDVEKKEFVALLKKTLHKGNLLTLTDCLKEQEKEDIKVIRAMFGTPYLTLKGKEMITWQELKSYILGAYEDAPKEDEKLFDDIIKGFLNYSGTYASFMMLSDSERTKMVKIGLERSEKICRAKYNIPKNIPHNEFLNIVIEKQILILKLKMEKPNREWKYSYRATKDDFDAEIIYDNDRAWHEQWGIYDCSGNEDVRIRVEKTSESDLAISLSIRTSNGNADYEGVCKTSQASSFSLKDVWQSTELQCEIINAKDGKLAITTTGSIEGTFTLDFLGIVIDSLIPR